MGAIAEEPIDERRDPRPLNAPHIVYDLRDPDVHVKVARILQHVPQGQPHRLPLNIPKN
ncbi:hypothetical protein [Microbacterium binotii]|uniref:hypothetical protein n=1 Tax=Microbacterium binotii TaxID=462710 RepID=UPI001F3F254B|nr:hypothetical protein [Microbacterium binotii]UIN31891.1 hypothetical protein LXM64_06810 [Microbacterium binotii]